MRAFLSSVYLMRAVQFAGGLVLMLLALTTSAGMQAPAGISVVVNSGVPVQNLTKAELRRLLLGDREFWESGVRVTLLIRAPVAPERDAAVRDVCQMTEAQFRQHWIAKVFRADTPSGPKIVYSKEAAMEQVSRVPGAITLVQGPVSGTSGMKVLTIDGRSLGQPGYSLR